MKRLLLAMMLCVCTLTMWAVPAKHITIEVKQPDGTLLTIVQYGDEHFHYFATEDGIPLKKNAGGYYYAGASANKSMVATTALAHNPDERSDSERAFVKALPQLKEVVGEARARALRNRSGAPQRDIVVPVIGQVRVPVILLQYKDKKFEHTASSFSELLNSDEYYSQERGYGSAQQYFKDQSEGAFVPVFEVLGPVTLSHNMSYYGGNDEEGNDRRSREMIQEACELLDGDVDFSRYDNDDDGYVDFVYAIYAGYGESSNSDVLENTIWPHKWYLHYPLQMDDGAIIYKYACSNELNGYEGTALTGIGTICHEFSHCLGLPDFYDIDYSGGFGMSSWDLMGGGNHNDDGYTPCGMSGYEKDYLGWKPLVELDEPTSVTMKAVTDGGTSYKIVNDATPREYYVVENRQKTKWDAALPASGMLVIHVDYKKSAWDNNGPNDDPNHQRMTIIPADNDLSTKTLKGDTYPGITGNTSLTSTSIPAARVYAGQFMNKDIVDIAEKDGIISFQFMKDPLESPRLVDTASNIQSDGFKLHWHPVEGADGYYVEIKKKAPFLVEEDFSKVTESEVDFGGSLGEHTHKKGWKGGKIYGLDGAIRVGTVWEYGYLNSHSFNCKADVFTIYITLRKSAATDDDPMVRLGLGDAAWDGQVWFYYFTLSSSEWVTLAYTYTRDKFQYGSSSYLYMDTKDGGYDDEEHSPRVDVDDIHVLPGDYASTVSKVAILAKSRLITPEECQLMIQNEVAAAALPQEVQPLQNMMPATRAFDFKQYNVLAYTAETTDTCIQCKGLKEDTYYCTVRSMKNGALSASSNMLEVDHKSWFENEGAYYRVVSSSESENSQVKVIASPKGNGKEDYVGTFNIYDDIEYKGTRYNIVGIADNAFKNATSLRMLDVKNDNLKLGQNLFHGCPSLNAIFWDTDAKLSDDAFDSSIGNLLLYLRDDVKFDSRHVEKGNIAVIQGGKCKSLTLDAEHTFLCPQEFVAEEVSYSRAFEQRIYKGESAGWETIALPFDVQVVSHEKKGELAPFGKEIGSAHFWLSKAGKDGFTAATAIHANTPYLLAFPNNYSYYGDNSIGGEITFAATNATIHDTACEPMEIEEYLLYPNYDLLSVSDKIYVLNVNSVYEGNKPGSVFVSARSSAKPFTAYMTPVGDQKTPAIYRIGEHQTETTESLVHDTTIEVHDGILCIVLPENREVIVCDMAGRRIETLHCVEGVNEYSHFPEGLYLIGKTKVCIKR